MNLLVLIPTLTACLLTMLGAFPTVALAQHQHEHAQHGHEQHAQHGAAAGAVAQLKLNGAAKWQTDAALRAGMSSIRSAFDTDHPAIRAGKQTDDAYAQLAGRVDQQVKTIVANCRLPADADANLHFIVADLLQGASLMRGDDPARSRHDGAALVHGALNAYGKFFDDPSLKGLSGAAIPSTPHQDDPA